MIKLGKIKFSYERGRQLLLFLFCLFLAFIIWSVHKLSQEYSVFLQYKVLVNSSLPGRAAESVSNDAITLKARASGFYILQQRYTKIGNLIQIRVDTKDLEKREGIKDGFYILTDNIKERLINYFGEIVTLESISTDTLNFFFPRQTNRTIPIAPKLKISYKDQYMASAEIKISPQEVIVYGSYSDVQNIDSVYTKLIKFDKLSTSKAGVITLQPINGIRFSVPEVYYSLQVERYVEKKVIVSLDSKNVPFDKHIIMLPSQVEVTYRVPTALKETINNSKFYLYIDFFDITNSINSYVKPIFETKPKELISYKIDPPYIEAKIIDK